METSLLQKAGTGLGRANEFPLFILTLPLFTRLLCWLDLMFGTLGVRDDAKEGGGTGPVGIELAFAAAAAAKLVR